MSTEPNTADDPRVGDVDAIDGPSPEVVVGHFFEAFARHDLDAICNLFTDDIIEDPGFGDPIEGIDNERAYLRDLWAALPDASIEVKNVMSVGRMVAVQYTRRGSFTGKEWQGLLPSGRSVVSDAGSFFEVEADRISRITVYTDSGRILRGLGVLPEEGSTGERLAIAMYRARMRIRRGARALRPRRK